MCPNNTCCRRRGPPAASERPLADVLCHCFISPAPPPPDGRVARYRTRTTFLPRGTHGEPPVRARGPEGPEVVYVRPALAGYCVELNHEIVPCPRYAPAAGRARGRPGSRGLLPCSSRTPGAGANARRPASCGGVVVIDRDGRPGSTYGMWMMTRSAGGARVWDRAMRARGVSSLSDPRPRRTGGMAGGQRPTSRERAGRRGSEEASS